MLLSSPKRQGLIRPQAIASTCFNALGEVHISIQILEPQSFTLSALGGAEFQC
jgi:hypothetical protein